MITEPLRSSGWFLDCDWRLACCRYIIANSARTNGRWNCRSPRWSASAWFNVGGACLYQSKYLCVYLCVWRSVTCLSLCRVMVPDTCAMSPLLFTAMFWQMLLQLKHQGLYSELWYWKQSILYYILKPIPFLSNFPTVDKVEVVYTQHGCCSLA
jgi:hypothetical protein